MNKHIPTKEEWEQWKNLEYYPYPRFKCECFCVGRIKVKSHHKYQGVPKYISGHNNPILFANKTFEERFGKKKAKEIRKKKQQSAKKYWEDIEHRKKQSEAMKGKKQSKSWVENRFKNRDRKQDSQRMIDMWKNPDYREMQSSSHIGFKQSKASNQKRSETRLETDKKNGYHHSPKTTEKIRKTVCGLWKNPEYQEKQRIGNSTFPNKPEQAILNILKEFFPGKWKYVGDKSFFIGGKNPDFISTQENKIIEVFGDYWHGTKKTGMTNEQHEQERKDYFKQYGYETLIIWECEINYRTSKEIANIIARHV